MKSATPSSKPFPLECRRQKAAVFILSQAAAPSIYRLEVDCRLDFCE